MKVFGRMLVLGRITATDISALQAHPEVDPSVAQFDTFLTDVRFRIRDLDLIEV
jgi:hypothetical protein